MNKTAAFTSLTMLLSVAQYGFAAESASELHQREGRNIPKKERESSVNIDTIRYE